nr:senescence-associated protein SPA15, chloroplastic isoform X2 [Tanacetum cinerariifolium]
MVWFIAILGYIASFRGLPVEAPSAEETEPFKTDESAATPPPHPVYRMIARISIPAPVPMPAWTDSEVRESLSAAAARPAGGLREDYGFVATVDIEIMHDPKREVGYGITGSWDEIVETLQGAPVSTDTELGGYVREFEMRVRQDTDEIYMRLDDEQTERQLLAGRLNMLFRDRRAHAYTHHLMETEARMSREAWVRATDASDLVYGEVMSLRTTVLGQMSEIRELQAADRRRQTVILELLRIDHRRSTEIIELRTALQGQVNKARGAMIHWKSIIDESIFRLGTNFSLLNSILEICPKADLQLRQLIFMAEVHGMIYSSAKSPHHPRLNGKGQGLVPRKLSHGQLSMLKLKLSVKAKFVKFEKLNSSFVSRASSFLCRSRETQTAETEECVIDQEDCSENFRTQGGDRQHIHPVRIGDTNQALAEACKFAYNDARYVNERAKSDIILLSRGIMTLDARARQDVAILGSGFLKLDARAREDTEKIDNDVKKRAEHLHRIALIFKNKAQSKLKSVADRHWSDGALEVGISLAIQEFIYLRENCNK